MVRSGPSLRTFGADGKCINHWRCKHIVIDFFFFLTADRAEGRAGSRQDPKEGAGGYLMEEYQLECSGKQGAYSKF